MTDICEVVITAPDAEWLAAFTHRLVEEHLVAGAHQIDAIRSTYWWHGEIVQRPEARVAFHTRRALVPVLIDRTTAEHPYEVPCVVAVPIVSANPEYERWVLDVTADAATT